MTELDCSDDVLVIFFSDIGYTQETDGGTGSLDNSIFSSLLGTDIGFALTADGEPLQQALADENRSNPAGEDRPFYSSGMTRANWKPSDGQLSERVMLYSGEEVRASDYELVVVAQTVFHVYYVTYLSENLHDTAVVAIQDEPVSAVTLYGSRLQMDHFEALSSVDGYIAKDEVCKSWLGDVVDDAVLVPFLVPDGHFDGFGPADERRDSVFLGGASWNLDLANFYTNVMVLEELRGRGFDLTGEFIGLHPWQKPYVAGYEEALDDVKLYPFLNERYYPHLSGLRLAVNLTERISVGRVSVDLAGVGVPCVGNVHNDLQRQCWPELSVEPHDTSTAADVAERLLVDERFYRRSVHDARRRVRELQDHEPTVEKLRDFLHTVHADA